MDIPPLPEDEVFEQARQIPDAALRRTFLTGACHGDKSLLTRLEGLLAAATEADALFSDATLAFSQSSLALSAAEAPGDQIGKYRLLERIGEGGSAVVYLAAQEEPIRRNVALKIIKLGMDTRAFVARFDAERQALALMDHPCIARVFDGGATSTGRPFFVMELVRGTTITAYCEQNRLSISKRLHLFLQVCHAVQHAHQKGIIHRDLKPSNILVTSSGGAPVPKVIDFGIAKALEGRLTENTLITAFEHFLGTPAYMSPEQAELTKVDIDTRSDIYSLGVLLYELLTGATPFEAKALLASGIDQLRRAIIDKEPDRPSIRVVREIENTTPRQKQPELIRSLRGDLDCIVMKCLEKDPSRRYQTAADLAADIDRHLTHQPVFARPPDQLYKLGKIVQRNKLVCAAVALFSLALIVAGLITVHAAGKARRAEAAMREKLWESYLAQAQAMRWSHRAGSRFDALDLLHRAAEIRPSLELRNEAIASMILSDLFSAKAFTAYPSDDVARGSFDFAYERYSYADKNGIIHIARVEDGAELLKISGYVAPVRGMEFSPNGRYLAFASDIVNHRVDLLDLATTKSYLQVTQANYRTFAFSSDSKFGALAVEAAGYPIRIFDLLSKEEIASFNHPSLPYIVSFHPQQSNLLLISDSGLNVRIWNWAAKTLVRTFVHPDWVQGIAWHPDGKRILTACGDGALRVWDADSGEQLASISGHTWAVERVSPSTDGEYLCSRSLDGTVRLWDLFSRHEIVRKPIWGATLNFGADRKFAHFLPEGRVEILQAVLPQGLRFIRPSPGGTIVNCDFTPDGKQLIIAEKLSLRLVDIASGQSTSTNTRVPIDYFVRSNPRGRSFFVNSFDGVGEWSLLDVTNSPAFMQKRHFPASWPWINSSLSGDGLHLGITTEDHFRMVDLITGDVRRPVKTRFHLMFSALNFDASLAAIWHRAAPNVQIWDVATTNLIRELPTGQGVSAAFSPDGNLFIAGDQLEYRAWSTSDWKQLYTIKRDNSAYWGVLSFSPNSHMAALLLSRTALRLIDSATGRELATLEAPNQVNIKVFTFSPDGTSIAVSTDSAVQLWNLTAIRSELATRNLNWIDPSPLPHSPGNHLSLK